MRVVQGTRTSGSDSIEATRPAGANLGAGPDARIEQAFLFQPSKGRLDRSGGDVALQSFFYFRENRATVRFFSEANNG
jgi:hypothetical protein